jgi:hypothetical protein
MEGFSKWLGLNLEKPSKGDGDSTDEPHINTYTRSHLETTTPLLKRSKTLLKPTIA